jgi:hypothetical protein
MKGSVAMSVAQPVSSQPQRSAMLGATRVFNRFTMLLAGTRLLPLYGVLVHRGRRSGKTFRTPVVVRPTNDGFIIPMPWGQGTDWAAFSPVEQAGMTRFGIKECLRLHHRA